MNLIGQLRIKDREIAELRAEIEHLSLLLALTLARGNIARERFIEVARMLREHEERKRA